MERQTARSPKKKQAKSTDYLVRIICVQLIICATLFALAMLGARVGGDGFSDALDEYKRLTEEDFGLEDLKAVLAPDGTEQSVKAPEASAPLEDGDADSETEAAATEAAATDVSAEKKPAAEKAAQKSQSTASAPAALSQSGNASASAILQSLLFDKPVVPVAGTRVTSDFGWRNHPVTGERHLHAGTDFGADTGDRVMAVLDGTVTRAEYSEARGNFLVLAHENGMETYYCHNAKLLVKQGTVVRAGEAIALAGSTGDSTGPHVHLEVHIDGEPQDPMRVLFTDDAL